MYTIRKKFRFEAAHILTSSVSKECQDIHGHSYIVEVFVSSENLNKDGMVIDFKILNQTVPPILEKWDHKLLMEENIFPQKKSHSVITGFNPTAENMAVYLYQRIKGKFPRLKIKIRVHETETGWAEYNEEI